MPRRLLPREKKAPKPKPPKSSKATPEATPEADPGVLGNFVTKLMGTQGRKIMEKFSPQEKEMFEQLVMNQADSFDGVGMDDLWKVDYQRKPPTMEEFIDDPYWLGQTMKMTDENPGLWPTWKKIAIDDFDLNSNISNVVITGSLGSGKTTVMVILFLYKITLVRLLNNPQNFFGLTKGTDIFFVVLSITKAVVTDTVWGYCLNAMAHSPFFRDECGFDPDAKYSNLKVNLGKGVVLSAGSKGQHIIGRNAMGVCMDEGNFRMESNPDLKAYELYDEVRTRIKNRFEKTSGFLPAISILASSATSETSFTEKVITEIEKLNDPSREKVYRAAVYRIKVFTKFDGTPNMELPREWFKVQYGLKNVEPCILHGWYDKDGNKIMDPFGESKEVFHENPVSGSKIELVPGNNLSEFKRRCRNALQNISGISIGGSNRLFPSTGMLEEACKMGEAMGVKDPTRGGISSIPVSEEDSRNIWDDLDHSKFLVKRASRYEPKFNPSALRYVHVDLAETSQAGLAICHRIGRKQVEGLIKDGMPFAEYRTVVQYDFILSFVAGTVKSISIPKIQRFLYWLRDRCNYQFSILTYDQFQSSMPLQTLEIGNFNVGKLSVDRDKKPYYSWRNAFEEERIVMYRQSVLMREAEELQDGDKVDHPPKGCFTGDTRIPLLDGTRPTISELEGKEVWVYSCRPDGKFVPGLARGRKTKSVFELVDVVLDSGAVIRCTPEHLFMLKNGTYKEAQSLRPGIDRLMAMTQCWPVNGGYEKITDCYGSSETTHRLVSEHAHGAIPQGYLVHHKNENKTDNRPENLEQKPSGKHASEHTAHRWKTDPEYRLKVTKGIRKFNLSEEGRMKHSEALKRTNAGVLDWFSRCRKKEYFRDDITRKSLESVVHEEEATNANSVARLIGCSRNVVMRVLREEGFTSWESFAIQQRSGNNHKVRMIIRVKLETPVSVYDLEVQEWDNFLLSSGIIVHNSKDVTDAACGAFFNAVTVDTKGGNFDANDDQPVMISGDLSSDGGEKPPISIDPKEEMQGVLRQPIYFEC